MGSYLCFIVGCRQMLPEQNMKGRDETDFREKKKSDTWSKKIYLSQYYCHRLTRQVSNQEDLKRYFWIYREIVKSSPTLKYKFSLAVWRFSKLPRWVVKLPRWVVKCCAFFILLECYSLDLLQWLKGEPQILELFGYCTEVDNATKASKNVGWAKPIIKQLMFLYETSTLFLSSNTESISCRIKLRFTFIFPAFQLQPTKFATILPTRSVTWYTTSKLAYTKE